MPLTITNAILGAMLIVLSAFLGIVIYGQRGKISSKKDVPTEEWKEYLSAHEADEFMKITLDKLPINDEQHIELLKFEYEKAQEMLQHYDNLNWNIGSILLGSNIIAMGWVVSTTTLGGHLFGAVLAGLFSLFCWLLWFNRHMAIYNVKSDRLYVIETMLGLYQHRMVGHASKRNWLGKPSGNKVAVLLWMTFTISWLLIFWLRVLL